MAAARFPLLSRPGPSRPAARNWRARLRWRRLTALALVLLAAFLAIQDRSSSRTVVVFRSALPAGHVLTAEDLRTRKAPAHLAPADAIDDPDIAVGAPLSGAVGPGEFLTATRIHSVAEQDTDSRLVSITVADPGVLDLVHVGSVVDIVGVDEYAPHGATGSDSRSPASASIPDVSRILVSSATVADVPRDRHGEPRGTVAVSVEPKSAAQLAAATLSTPLTLSIAG